MNNSPQPSKVLLFSDGGSRGNPGPAGAGYALFDAHRNEIFGGKKFLGTTTNNVAEYTALILGLRKAHELEVKSIDCFLDSELIVKQLNGHYKVKHPDMKILFARVLELKKGFEKITFSHVPREDNKRADQLANEAMDEGK